MTTPTTIQTLASEVSALFRTDKRNDGSEFITYDGELSDWITAMIRAAHDDMAPDDHKYAFVVEALDAIAEADDVDEVSLEADIYTHGLLRWLASNLHRPGYCDQAMEDMGNEFKDTVSLISLGQWAEKNEVLSIVRSALRDRLASMEDEDTADDVE